MKKQLQRFTAWIVNILFYGCMALLLWLFCQVFVFSSFKIPTDSMIPEVTAGDHVLVLKPIIGARLFDLFEVAKGEQPDIYRLSGFRQMERNDILVFNFPCPQDWNKIEMNLMSYYIKRCVGLPGDTLSIVDGLYQVNGIQAALGNLDSQTRIKHRNRTTFDDGVFRTFPYDSVIDWNIKDFGPLYIPKKGAVVSMNRSTYVLYKKLIEWETRKVLSLQNDIVFLSGEAIGTYRFQKNYYFMAGDRSEDSQDSRYWGLLPEEYIVGKAWIVWKSVDPYTGKFRWNRFLKRIQ